MNASGPILLAALLVADRSLAMPMPSTQESAAQRWLAHTPVTPELEVPGTQKEWALQREAIRAQLWKLLGDLPPRPKVPQARLLSREQRDGYTLEKFQFDNAAGATVPGWLILPQNAPGPVSRHPLLSLARGTIRDRQGRDLPNQCHPRGRRPGSGPARLRGAGH